MAATHGLSGFSENTLQYDTLSFELRIVHGETSTEWDTIFHLHKTQFFSFAIICNSRNYFLLLSLIYPLSKGYNIFTMMHWLTAQEIF